MKRRPKEYLTGTIATGSAVAMLLVGAGGCERRTSDTTGLADAIEEGADALRRSGRPQWTVEYAFEAEEPWSLVFVPPDEFDADLAEAAGVPSKMRDAMVQQAQAWGRIPLLVYATKGATRMTRMPETVHIPTRILLRGDRRCQMEIALTTAGDVVSMTQATCKDQP